MRYKNIIFKKKEGIASVTLNNPARNYLTAQVLEELKCAFESVLYDDEIEGIIITGKKHFSYGFDPRELSRMTYQKAKQFSQTGHEVFSVLSRIDRPVIAIISGNAIGGGCELALACDTRLATTDAVFSPTLPNTGVTPCFGGSIILPKIVGKELAGTMISSGKRIKAYDAFQMGLVDSLVDKNNAWLEAEQLLFSRTMRKYVHDLVDFADERERFARCFLDLALRKKIRSLAR
ncbi:MAG: enoyl-CoA hydratase/isomerase family protein [Nanoarchaeota archaeon]